MRRFSMVMVILWMSATAMAAVPATAPATKTAAQTPLPAEWWAGRGRTEAALLTDPRLLARLAHTQALVGSMSEWRRLLDVAEREAARIPDAKKQCEAYLAVAEVCAATGDRDGYARCIKAARRYLDQSTDIVERATTSQFLAVTQAVAGDSDGWNSTVREMANLNFRADICVAVAETLVERGDRKQYLEAAELGRQAAVALNDPMATSMLLRSLAAIHAKAGDSEAAAALADSIREPTWKAMAYASIAEAQLKVADLINASRSIERAKAIPFGQMVWGEMELMISLAALEHAAGNQVASKQLLKAARERADAYINPFRKAAGYVELAAAQLRLGDKAGAAESLKSAEISRATMPSTQTVDLDQLPGKYSALALAQAASGDFAAALATAKAISRPDLRLVAYAGIARELASAGQFEAAASLVAELPTPEARSASIRSIAANWAKSANSQRLKDWMESLPTPLDRAEACVQVVLSLRPRLPGQS